LCNEKTPHARAASNRGKNAPLELLDLAKNHPFSFRGEGFIALYFMLKGFEKPRMFRNDLRKLTLALKGKAAQGFLPEAYRCVRRGWKSAENAAI
jgi:hypothetical protein